MIDNLLLSDIYDRYGSELLIFIAGFVRNRDTAEDILHDAFVRLIRYSQNYPLDESNIRAFLYKTARNLCIDHARRNRLRRESTLEDTVEYTGSRTLHEDVEYNELRHTVEELLDKKDPIARSVYIMRTELTLPYREIAKILGISERTAKRKMKAMLEYLAVSLEKSGFKLLFLICVALIAFKSVI